MSCTPFIRVMSCTPFIRVIRCTQLIKQTTANPPKSSNKSKTARVGWVGAKRSQRPAKLNPPFHIIKRWVSFLYPPYACWRVGSRKNLISSTLLWLRLRLRLLLLPVPISTTTTTHPRLFDNSLARLLYQLSALRLHQHIF